MLEDDNLEKKISFTGTATKYQMKKMITEKKVIKRKKFNSSLICSHEKQLEIIQDLQNNKTKDDIIKDEIKNQSVIVIVKECIDSINKKIASYKQQDILKEKFNKEDFINFTDVISILNNCNLKCCYCESEVFILYEMVRECKQWTLDRINNDIGHNKNNVVISCLECNLKRRKTNKDAFMFTKNLKITREEY